MCVIPTPYNNSIISATHTSPLFLILSIYLGHPMHHTTLSTLPCKCAFPHWINHVRFHEGVPVLTGWTRYAFMKSDIQTKDVPTSETLTESSFPTESHVHFPKIRHPYQRCFNKGDCHRMNDLSQFKVMYTFMKSDIHTKEVPKRETLTDSPFSIPSEIPGEIFKRQPHSPWVSQHYHSKVPQESK